MAETDIDMFFPGDSAYYSYSKKQPFYKRLFRLGRYPYCERCRKSVKMYDRILGLPVAEKVITELHESGIVKSLFNQEWFVIDTVTRLHDWALQPAILISLGHCETCDGPFIVYSEILGVSNNTLNLGVIFSIEVEKKSALELLEKAIDRGLIANDAMYNNAVNLCKVLGSAKDFAQITSTRQRKKAALDLAQKGMALLNKGNLEQAEETFNSALQVFKELEDRESQAMIYMQLGIEYYRRRQLDQAETLLNRSLVLHEETDNKPEMALNYGVLGTVHFDRKELDQAELLFRKALEIDTNLDNQSGMARGYRSLADVFKEQGKKEQAKDAYTELLKLSKEIGDATLIQDVLAELDRLKS